MSGTVDIPAGFAPHFRKSPLTDPWEPLYSKQEDGIVCLGLRLTPAHTNARGFAHGGLISALCDNAMGLSCGVQMETPASIVTINLSIDYEASAQIGQWLEIRPDYVRVGRTLGFAQCIVLSDGNICARGRATFRIAQPR